MPAIIARRRSRAPAFLTTDPLATGFRFTVERYHELGESGVLSEADRIELIDGWVVEKSMHNPPHAIVLTRLTKRLARLISETFEIRFQLPITLSTSEPEPDAVVAIGPEERYRESHPTAKDIALVVEASDSSLEIDRGTKLLIYAAARIPVYWIVNIPDDRIEMYTDPRAGKHPTYRSRTDFLRGQKIPVVLNGTRVGEIAANDILP